MSGGPTVMWFRRDLRLGDNPALVEALRAGAAVVPLFVLDDALWGPSGAARRAFLVGCLAALDSTLDGHLVVRRGRPEDVLPAVARECGARQVWAAEDFGPYGRRRDDRVADALRALDAELIVTGSSYAVPPGAVRNRSGTPYRVFTPFARAWTDHGWAAPLRAPANPTWLAVEGGGLPEAPPIDTTLPEPGEQAARTAARRFWDHVLDGYATTRDQPGVEGSSRLSPYLKWGCLHPRQLLSQLDARRPDHRTFRDELCWREFYADVLFHDPGSARQAWVIGMRDMRTDNGAEADRRFDAWATGRTGYPFVDAGMRQLRAQGWMHNRARMVTASFLVKDLHLDWARGARWFMRHLVDGDIASNQHGWQWVAGTGTDAAPFIRVFNPVRQSRRFDPNGDYIRTWLPELRDIPGKAVHEPWLLPGGPPAGYPARIVDHDAERTDALDRIHSRS